MADGKTFGGDIVWGPSPGDIARSHLTAFMQRYGMGSFEELMQRSTGDVEWFTDAVLKYLGIRFQKPYERAVDTRDGIQFPKWCVGGHLNITASCLDRWIEDEATRGRAALRISCTSLRMTASTEARVASPFSCLSRFSMLRVIFKLD